MGLEPDALDKIATAAEAALGLCDSYIVFDSSGQVLAAHPDRVRGRTVCAVPPYTEQQPWPKLPTRPAP
jgi:hypothetical protein